MSYDDPTLGFFNKLMSIGVCGNEFHVKAISKFVKNTYAFKKYGVPSTLVLLSPDRYNRLSWLVIFGNDASLNLRTNPPRKADVEQAPQITILCQFSS